MTKVSDLRAIEYLVERLAYQVGSPVSYQFLAEDIGVSSPTIKRWIAALEELQIIFALYPYTRKIKRAILKQPKIYFFDWARIPAIQASARFENLVAAALLKSLQFETDTCGRKISLHYLRDKEKREVDFLVTEGATPRIMIECKLSLGEQPNFRAFSALPCPRMLLVKEARHDETRESF